MPLSSSLHHLQPNITKPQEDPLKKEKGVSSDIFEHVNVLKILLTLISHPLEVASSLQVTLRRGGSFREVRRGWSCSCCRDGARTTVYWLLF